MVAETARPVYLGIARLANTVSVDDGRGSHGATSSVIVLESAFMLSGETDSRQAKLEMDE